MDTFFHRGALEMHRICNIIAIKCSENALADEEIHCGIVAIDEVGGREQRERSDIL
jgi:hypothetical protein